MFEHEFSCFGTDVNLHAVPNATVVSLYIESILSVWRLEHVSDRNNKWHAKPKGSICILYKQADTAFWLCGAEFQWHAIFATLSVKCHCLDRCHHHAVCCLMDAFKVPFVFPNLIKYPNVWFLSGGQPMSASGAICMCRTYPDILENQYIG